MSAVVKNTNCDLNKIRPGHLMAFTYWGRVVSTNKFANEVTVTGLDGKRFKISGEDLIEAGLSADQYSASNKVTHTEIAKRLIESWGKPFTVVFVKANGEQRTLRGRLVSSEHLLGRSMVEDLDAVAHGKNGLRQVDHRTIESLILDGVKYFT